jgi:hypothetical protein
VRKLLEVRGSRSFDHEQNALEYDTTRATYPGRGGWSVGSVMVVVHPPERGISLNRSGLCECRSQWNGCRRRPARPCRRGWP